MTWFSEDVTDFLKRILVLPTLIICLDRVPFLLLFILFFWFFMSFKYLFLGWPLIFKSEVLQSCVEVCVHKWSLSLDSFCCDFHPDVCGRSGQDPSVGRELGKSHISLYRLYLSLLFLEVHGFSLTHSCVCCPKSSG